MVTIALAVAVLTGIFVLLSALLLVAERSLANYGDCTVTINGGAVAFTVPGGGTLLKALNERRIFIPSACGGKSSCGYCKVTVTQGGGPILPTETPFMSRAEVRIGTRLACQVKIKSDLEVAFPESLLAVKEFHARVSGVKALTYDIRELTMALQEPNEISFRPGQYIQIQAPSAEGPVFRAYSISSPSFERNQVQLMVRLVPGGIASTYIHGLHEGDDVSFTGPYGEFRLSEDPTVPVVCVGGGAGMAPISCILESLLRTWPERPCHLYFGCRGKRDVFYLDHFTELSKAHPNFHVTYALSDPLATDEKWAGDTGFVHLSVDKRLPADGRSQAFLCGPPPMIDAVTEVLKQKGLGDESIFYDKF